MNQRQRLLTAWVVFCTWTLAVVLWLALSIEANGQGPAGPASVASATVRIVNDTSSAKCYGSGTLIEDDGQRGRILTCAHTFRREVGTIVVTFSTGRSYGASLAGIDHAWDLALLKISSPGVVPVAVADQYPQVGELLESCGHGPDGRYWCNRGRALGYAKVGAAPTRETLALSGYARDGDSGGPVINQRGELVAVIWGTDGRTVHGTYCGRIRKFLDRFRLRRPLRPPAIPGSPLCPPGGCPAAPIAPMVPVVPPIAPMVPPVIVPETPPPDNQYAGMEALGDRLGVVEGRLGDIGRRLGSIAGTIATIQESPADEAALETAIQQTVAPMVADGATGAVASLLPWVFGALGLGGATPLAMGGYGTWRLLRRRRRRKGGAADAAESFPREDHAAWPRDSSEAAELLRLSQLEGRDPLHDAIVGRFADDELSNTIDRNPDSPESDWARRLRRTLEDRFNAVAPLATVGTNSQGA